MHPQLLDTINTPVLSAEGNIKMADGDLSEYGHNGRSSAFLDAMKQNVPSVARIPSPKPHHKHHHKHHHHHHHKQNGSGSPNMHKKNLETRSSYVDEGSNSSPFLTPFSAEGFRRSYSDSSLYPIPSTANDEKNIRRRKSPAVSPAVSPATSPRSQQNGFMFTRQDGGIHEQQETKPDFDSATQCMDEKGTITGSTITRDLLVDKDECYQGTITRRKAELLKQVLGSDERLHKKRTMKMIDQLIHQCHSNYNTVVNDTNFAFTRLHSALENRRKELLEDARSMRDLKIKNLEASKDRCAGSQGLGTVNNSDNESEMSYSPVSLSRAESLDQDVCLQSNGILEPWKASTGEYQVDGDKVAEKLERGKIFSDILEEGNVSFVFNEEKLEMFATIGQLENKLSSPQYSFTKGLQNGMALVGETVKFEVHTRNKSEAVTFNPKDDIKCRVFNSNDESVDITSTVSLHRCLSSGRMSPLSPHMSQHKFYSYSFAPKIPGKYNISVLVNNVEIKNSPFKYSVYPKVDLTFDLCTPEEKKDMTSIINNIGENTKSIVPRQSSEDGDWTDDDWIVQKGDKSSLLASARDVPSFIYAAPAVSGFCAWKLRVTSACQSIELSIGVGTRTGIPDIDEHYACHFNCQLNKTKRLSGRPLVRRTSSFTRVSMTYDVLLSTDEGIVRVMSEQDENIKTVLIDRKVLNEYELYPFISMAHRHESCSKQVCPRPQITLL